MDKKNNWLKLESVILLLLFAVCLLNMDFLAGFVNKTLLLIKPFLYGAFIAYLLCPLCNRIENFIQRVTKNYRKRESTKLWRNISIFLSLILFLLIIGVVVYLIVPQLIISISTVVAGLPDMILDFRDSLAVQIVEFPELQSQVADIADHLAALAGNINVNTLFENLVGSVKSTLGTVYDIFIGIIFAIYLLANTKILGRQGRLLFHSFVPDQWADRLIEEIKYADEMFSGFLIGKVIDSFIIGIIAYIVFLVFGFSDSLLLAAIVGVTNIIPFFGPFIGLVPCALFVLMKQGLLYGVGIVVLIFILQQFDGNFLGPKVLGKKVGLSSMWVFVSIIFFGNLWGLAGMFVSFHIKSQ